MMGTAEVVRKLVDERVAALRGSAPGELIHLPASSVETLVSDRRRIRITTYHHVLSAGKHLIVVRGFREWLRGTVATGVAVSGIEVSGGAQHLLTRSELTDYLQLLGL